MAKYYVTTPIYYINDKAHIGHAYSTIVADVLARYHRHVGDQVLFSTGTDENSQKTVRAAEKAGRELQPYTDEMADSWKHVWDDLNISYDRFIRTTEADHKKAVYAMFEAMERNGDIYKDTYQGIYCVGHEDFLKEEDLVDGKCPDHGEAPQVHEEENYFFRLSKYQQPLLEHFKKHPEFVRPRSRYNEALSFIESGLEDISISRQSQQWGIPFPGDEAHVIYVWAEALINYLTVTGYPAPDYKAWWPADVHVIGKDIVKFHAVIWPAMLMSAGLSPPKTILAGGFLTIEGTKISKSLGNVVSPLELAKLHGNEAMRYILLRDTPFGEDGEFSYQRFHELYNAELANDLGNLVQRTASMVQRYQDGQVGDIPPSSHDIGPYEAAMGEFRFDKALEHIWIQVRGLNQYLEEQKPWELAKSDDQQALADVLAYVVGGLWEVASLLAPFMPETAGKIQQTFAGDTVDPDVGILFPKYEMD